MYTEIDIFLVPFGKLTVKVKGGVCVYVCTRARACVGGEDFVSFEHDVIDDAQLSLNFFRIPRDWNQ